MTSNRSDRRPIVPGIFYSIDSNPANAHTGTNSLKLNGGYAGVVGLSKSYKVYPGDKLHIDAYAKVESQSCSNCGSSGLGNFATVLFNAFNVSAPAIGETGTLSAGLNAWAGVNTAAGYGDGSSDNTDPKVFVTIVIFDKNYKFIEVAYSQLTSSGGMSADFTVKEAGYAIMYVSNEISAPIYVYFDDVTMKYTPTNIIQSNEYYAHSMPTANSWTRDNNTNNFLGNGGTELNATTQLYDLAYRNYDATLGRFHQIDPLASQFGSQTPYNYAFNNPVLLNDPMGDRPQPELIQDNQYIPRPDCLDRSDNYDTGGGYYGGGGGGMVGFGRYGASYTNNGDGTFTGKLFESYEEAFAAGAAYNEKHKSWDQTAYGSYFGSVVSYVGSTVYGTLLSPTQVNAAISIVWTRHNQQNIRVSILAINGRLGDYLLEQDGTFSIDKAIAWLNKNAYSSWNTVPKHTVKGSDGKSKEVFWYRCATWIINALNAGFDDGKDHTASTRSVFAKNDGPALESIGFKAVTGDLTSLEKGDIIIFQPSNASAAGHIEMWTGTQFISDWKQGSSFYPNSNRTCEYPSFTVYRYTGN